MRRQKGKLAFSHLRNRAQWWQCVYFSFRQADMLIKCWLGKSVGAETAALLGPKKEDGVLC